jgi:hypothetical protein
VFCVFCLLAIILELQVLSTSTDTENDLELLNDLIDETLRKELIQQGVLNRDGFSASFIESTFKNLSKIYNYDEEEIKPLRMQKPRDMSKITSINKIYK